MRFRWILLALPVLALTGCMMGPNYKRPDVPMPGQYRGAAGASIPPSASSLADTKSADLFDDEALKKLLATAVGQNFDLKIAAGASIPPSASSLADTKSADLFDDEALKKL